MYLLNELKMALIHHLLRREIKPNDRQKIMEIAIE
jgi:hypothetical protein